MSTCRFLSCTGTPIPRSISALASACLRWRMSPSNLSAFPAAVTRTSTTSAPSRRRGVSLELQMANGSRCSALRSSLRLGDRRMSIHEPMPRSAWIFPALSVLLFAVITALHYDFAPSAAGLVFATVLLVILFGTVFAAVHHADMIAIRIGEPFGTLLLTLAVTVIEVALIESLMLSEKAVTALARDTVFAVVMIVCNALVGICILAGGLRYREQDIQVSGSNLYLSVLAVLATITLILPNYTLTTPGPVFSTAQLGFVSFVTILLYGVFLYTQTVRQ